MKSWFGALAVAIGLSLTAGAALAAPVTWAVPPTTLPNGAVVSGTFVYDTATSAISNVNITQTVVNPGVYTYTTNFPDPYRGGQRTAVAALNDETWWVYLPGIPATGGTFVATIGTGGCLNVGADLCDDAYVLNSVSSATLTGVPVATAVPTLSEWAMILFGTALAGGAAIYIQRRRLVA